MRFIITGGGTGGHVYPALAVAERLKDSQVLYVGTSSGLEREIVSRWGLPFREVSSAPFRGLNPLRQAVNLLKVLKGIWEAWKIVKEFSPDAIFATGGYVSVPVVLAGKLQGIPSLIYLPDLEPGLAVRFLSMLASRVAVTFPEVMKFFPPEKTVVTGYPVRRELLEVTAEEGRKYFGLEDGLKTVLVFGGSRGARSINRALADSLEVLLDFCQVIHISGSLDYGEMKAVEMALPPEKRNRYKVFPYLHREMGLALAAADLVVSRAGAATLGEFPALGKPAILIPYPYAGGHQERNARFLADKGAALVIPDHELSDAFLPTVLDLLRDDEKLRLMKEKAKAIASPGAAEKLAELLRELPSR